MAAEKAKKIKYYNLCIKLNVYRKYEGKTSSINMKLGENKIKLTGRNFDFSVKCCLEPFKKPYMENRG